MKNFIVFLLNIIKAVRFFSLPRFFIIILIPLLQIPISFSVFFSESQTELQERKRQTQYNLPLPRFVSLKYNRVNLRTGPGVNYSVDWLYVKAGLPIEILQEYDNWRRVRDVDGIEGWINKSLLSGKRTGIIAPWKKGNTITIKLMDSPYETGRILAFLEPRLIGKIKSCTGTWCNMVFGSASGWVRQPFIWGAYPNEKIF